MQSKHRMVLVVGMVCAVVAGNTSPAHATMAPAPCALLTPDEVSAALGAKVGAPQPIATTGCQWVVPNPHMFVTVSIWPPDGFEQMKAPFPNTTKSAVSGIGDDAISATMAGFTSLSVKKGNTVFIVKVYGVPDQAKQATIEKTLAALVAGRV